jgi:hypothetical protein
MAFIPIFLYGSLESLRAFLRVLFHVEAVLTAAREVLAFRLFLYSAPHHAVARLSIHQCNRPILRMMR